MSSMEQEATSKVATGAGAEGRSLNNQLENIKVAVRLRPFTQKERERNNKRIVDIQQNTVVLYNLNYNNFKLRKFTFDYSYWSHDGFKRDQNGLYVPDLEQSNCDRYAGQDKVFEDLGSFLLKNALEGYNSALLAYGQTGSGKSYTVSGYGQNEGILPRFARALFIELEKKVNESSIKSKGNASTSIGTNRYEVYFSMIEIYNEVVRDLLAKNHEDMRAQSSMFRRGLKVREHPKHGFFVENLTSFLCANKDEIELRIQEGQLNKSIAATSMNEMSSRGHSIYEFRIKQYVTRAADEENASNGAGADRGPEETLTTSVVQLVDLAGSERMAVHVTASTDGSIGSRSNTPRLRLADKPLPRTRTSEVATSSALAVASPASASSSNESSSQAVQSRRTVQSQTTQQAGNLPPTDGSATHSQRFKESVAINQSLSALGNCIQVMSQYSQQFELDSNQKKKPPLRIPYRDSVLTKLLNRCCLSGNSKLVLIATLSPIDSNYDDTLSTLRFADRAKRIRTHATINKVEKSEILNGVRRKGNVESGNSDQSDSSRASRFDDNETAEENLVRLQMRSGAKSSNYGSSSDVNAIDVVSTPTRSRKVSKRSDLSKQTMVSSRSNPTLAIKQEQMKRIVSPKTSTNELGDHIMSRRQESCVTSPDELDLNELDNIEEDLLSSDDSDDDFISLSAFRLDADGGEEMTTEEKIQLFNKMLSNSSVIQENQSKSERPKRSNNRTMERADMQRVPMIGSSLKRSNPYLSNLNPDEQLTGVIGYILKKGETIVGKSKECDVVLHGPELRGRHAKLIRDEDNTVYIEPITLGDQKPSDGRLANDDNMVAMMVNGSPVGGRTQLNHCDRLLFGTNAYFVFANSLAKQPSSTGTLADLDMVTYDMARNEVLRKYMAESKTEAVLKEINEYRHRPGTGKLRLKSSDQADGSRQGHASSTTDGITELSRTMTIQDDQEKSTRSETADAQGRPLVEPEMQIGLSSHPSITTNMAGHDEGSKSPDESGQEDQETIYRKRLREDTYEYTLPVAEVNAVAKEMGIEVQYKLKILTGEEQLFDDQLNNGTFLSSQMDSSMNAPDGLSLSSSSQGRDSGEASRLKKNIQLKDQGSGLSEQESITTYLTKLDGLDIQPALYIQVHLEEFGIDFYWSKEKLEARRDKILELYGPWDVGGKSGLVEHLIDLSKYQGDYLIDPFVDDPASTFVLIGHAQITLTPISHLSDLEESFDIIDMDDGIVGSVRIQATPCDTNPLPVGAAAGSSSNDHDNQSSPYRVFDEVELEKCLLDSPRYLLNEKMVFRLKIKSCHNVPDRYCNIFCQYKLGSESRTIRTKLLREYSDLDSNNHTPGKVTSDQLTFDHSHYICFERVDQDIMDFLQHGFLAIQLIGQYKLSAEDQQKPLTVITTIINSINKYKMKIGQLSAGGFSNGSPYFGSRTDSSKSNRGQSSSGAMNSNSASSVVSNSVTNNLFDAQNDDEDVINSVNSLSQEDIIDMILTKRKLDRAENQLHYLKRTIYIAEHYNKKHIPLQTIKKLLNSYGHELGSGTLEEFADVAAKARSINNKSSACSIQ